MKISAVVLTRNEESNIKDCLASLSFCEEIIVVDDNSQDKTRLLARQLGARVFKRLLNDEFSSQRNFGLKKVKNNWALFVDTDERISSSLRDEIINAHPPAGGSMLNGFFLRRRDFFLGRWLKHGETSRIKLLRLARKDAGRWQGKVHETWQIKGRVCELQEPLLHYSHLTLTEFLEKINRYTDLRARELKRFSWQQLFFYPALKFIQNYFLFLGFLDGFPGLIIAWLMSFHSLIVRIKIWEKNNA